MAEVAVKPGHTELRIQVSDDIVAVLDAKSISLQIPRNRYVIRVLRERAAKELEEHIVMARVLQGNPTVFQSDWKASEPIPIGPDDGLPLVGDFTNASLQRR